MPRTKPADERRAGLLASLQERFVGAFAESVRAAADAERDWPAKIDAPTSGCFGPRSSAHAGRWAWTTSTAHPADGPGKQAYTPEQGPPGGEGMGEGMGEER